MLFTESQNNTLQFLINFSSILSAIGCGSILISTIYTGNLIGKNKFWNRIIFYMSFWDTCISVDLILRQLFLDSRGEYCKFHGLTLHFFFLCSILWTAAFAFTIFFVAVLNKKINEIEKYEKCFHIVIGIISLLLTVPLYFILSNNSSFIISEQESCGYWMTKEYRKYSLYFFYIPLWIIFFFNTFVYTLSEVLCKKRDENMNISFKNTVVKRSYLYLLVIFITWIWGSLGHIIEVFNKTEDNQLYILYLFQAFFIPLQGFLNSVVYFWFSVIQHSIDKKKMEKVNQINHSYSMNDITINNTFFDDFDQLNGGFDFKKPPKILTKRTLEDIYNADYSDQEFVHISILNYNDEDEDDNIGYDDDETMTNENLLTIDMENYYRNGLPVSPIHHHRSYVSANEEDEEEEYDNFQMEENNINRFSLSIVNGIQNSLQMTMNDNKPDTTIQNFEQK